MSVLPPDPSVPGAHWLRHPTKGDVIWDWKPRRYTRPDVALGEWRHGSRMTPGAAAIYGWSYLRPCPTPAALAQMDAEHDLMVGTIEDLRAHIATLTTRLDEAVASEGRLREALHFYAYPGPYTGRPSDEETLANARAALGKETP